MHKKSRSPWLHQLNHDRVIVNLTSDIETDIAVVGAGIAGIATAFFTLLTTNKKVVVLEGHKLAHGATGHNAGQIVSYFERPLSELVYEFGLEQAIAAQKAIEDSWELLDFMYTEANLSLPLSRFKGHAGYTTEAQVEEVLKNNYLRVMGGLNTTKVLIAENLPFATRIAKEYEGLYELVPHAQILELLETNNKKYIASLSITKGVMNSALFCEELVAYLTEKYGERFMLYENTHVRKIVLHENECLLDAGEHTIRAERVVLCTNGFENLTIFDTDHVEINTSYHHHVYGRIGYMSGYLERFNKQPTAISYYTEPTVGAEKSYYYLTRRPYEYEKGVDHNLVCIGGPDQIIDERDTYMHDTDSPEEANELINTFLQETYDLGPNKKVDYVFTWHGLMGYTKNYVRMIGTDPRNERLLYNLGCNGVGILPSIFGGKRIARILSGEKVEPSIFDIRL